MDLLPKLKKKTISINSNATPNHLLNIIHNHILDKIEFLSLSCFFKGIDVDSPRPWEFLVINISKMKKG
jgi:hypothetical protein